MQRRTFIIGLVSLAVACNRWRPGHPRQVALGSPDVAFDATLATLKLEQYRIESVDEHHYTIHARAKLDQHKDDAVTMLTFQVYDDDVLEVTFHGRHVREGGKMIHRKLETELDELLRLIHRAAIARSAG
jgi:hypothetical protein